MGGAAVGWMGRRTAPSQVLLTAAATGAATGVRQAGTVDGGGGRRCRYRRVPAAVNEAREQASSRRLPKPASKASVPAQTAAVVGVRAAAAAPAPAAAAAIGTAATAPTVKAKCSSEETAHGRDGRRRRTREGRGRVGGVVVFDGWHCRGSRGGSGPAVAAPWVPQVWARDVPAPEASTRRRRCCGGRRREN